MVCPRLLLRCDMLIPIHDVASLAWNAYQCNVDENLIIQTAQQMKSLGLLEAGYSRVNLDDCYASKNRSASGEIVAGTSALH